MSKFQVGDRVVCVKADRIHATREEQIDATGVVKQIHDDCFAVEHDKKDDRMFHDCGGVVEEGRGWWYYPHELELLEVHTSIAVDDLI